MFLQKTLLANTNILKILDLDYMLSTPPQDSFSNHISVLNNAVFATTGREQYVNNQDYKKS